MGIDPLRFEDDRDMPLRFEDAIAACRTSWSAPARPSQEVDRRVRARNRVAAAPTRPDAEAGEGSTWLTAR